ncbi:MAG TPA: NAD(P)H-hydrate dehydratase [Allosphingosinicella sp.]|nr:NAD(P)H-hydrate dehydratase [Allosphingosinicella sp.]
MSADPALPEGVEALDRALLQRYPLPRLAEDGDKEDRGRLLVIAGSRELAGAALLAGVGALRAGAGKLQIATAASIATALAVAVPEARVMGFEETDEGCLAPAGIERLIEAAKGAAAISIGCGLQFGPPLDALLDALLESGVGAPLVLDAAVLGSLAPRAEKVRAWRGGAILLPHSREMARLLGCDTAAVEGDPLGAARDAAGRFGAVSLIKGEYSYIVAPDGRAFRFTGGGVGLATSGSGDVLAGIVGGLAARGADPLTATLWGVYLHGEAGRSLAKRVGRVGFLARELLDEVPRLLGD